MLEQQQEEQEQRAATVAAAARAQSPSEARPASSAGGGSGTASPGGKGGLKPGFLLASGKQQRAQTGSGVGPATGAAAASGSSGASPAVCPAAPAGREAAFTGTVRERPDPLSSGLAVPDTAAGAPPVACFPPPGALQGGAAQAGGEPASAKQAPRVSRFKQRRLGGDGP